MYSFTEIIASNVKTFAVNILGNVTTYKSEIFVGVIALFVAYYIGTLIRKARSNFPPGPYGLPLIGYIPFLGKNMHLDFIELGKKYGDVFSISMGPAAVVVLNDIEVIKEAFSKPEFLGRMENPQMEKLLVESPFFAGKYHVWQEQRRFIVHSMKDLGLGKSKIENNIQDEIGHFLSILREHNGQAMKLKAPLAVSVSNNISALVLGKRLEYDDPDQKVIHNAMDNVSDATDQKSFFLVFLMFIPVINKLFGLSKIVKSMKKMIAVFKKEIERHRQTFDPKNIRDFIDSYLLEMETRKRKDSTSSFTEQSLIGNAIDLYGAGSETVSASILWIIYIIAAYPDVQKKVQQEILDVVGSERFPDFMDQKEMPYTHAVLLEIMRWKTMVPLNLPRCTLADTTVGGYDLPEGTVVVANFWNVHHNPKYWTEPDKFKPERFLNVDGTSVVKPNYFIPFSMGKRSCPGETMAQMEIFLYFTSILQKFDVVFPEGFKPTYEARPNIIYRMYPYDIRFLPK